MIESEAPTPGMSVEDIRMFLSADGRPISSTNELLCAHGIPIHEANSRTVPIDLCWQVFSEHAALVSDEMHGAAQCSLKPGSTTLLIAPMLVCDSLEEAIEAYRDAARVLIPDIEFALIRRGAEATLRWRTRDELSALGALVLESTAVVLFAVFRWLADERISVLRTKAPKIREGSSSKLMAAFDAPVVYDGAAVDLVFAHRDLTQRLSQHKLSSWRDGVFSTLTAIVIASKNNSYEGAFTAAVRAELLRGYGQKEISNRWGISTKTIARRLAQEGSSFRQLRDEIRMNKAASLIHAEISVEEVGYLIGYEDPRSFRRAFTRWFGESPSAYRSERSAA